MAKKKMEKYRAVVFDKKVVVVTAHSAKEARAKLKARGYTIHRLEWYSV